MNSLPPFLEANDLSVVDLAKPEHGKSFFTLENELAQRDGADGNLAMRPRWLEKYDTAPNLNVRRLLSEVTPFHFPSHKTQPERDRNGALSLIKFKRVTDVTVPFLPTARFLRQTAVSFPTLGMASPLRAEIPPISNLADSIGVSDGPTARVSTSDRRPWGAI